jgi:Putative Actinobacterial Holin-X, holin superfamily III
MAHEHASLRELIADLKIDVQTLVRQEIALARAEIREELRTILLTAAALAAGLFTLAVAGLWVLIAVTRGLAAIFEWPLWGVYAAVGVVLGAVGVILLAVARHGWQTLRILPKTRETLRMAG